MNASQELQVSHTLGSCTSASPGQIMENRNQQTSLYLELMC